MSRKNTIRHPVLLLGDRAYEVNASPNKPLNAIQIKTIVKRMTQYHRLHAKICVQVFVLHRDSYTLDNRDWSKSIKSLDKQLTMHFGVSPVLDYFCVRERDRSEAQHYHLALVLDGQVTNRKYSVHKILSKVWSANNGQKVTHIQTHNVSKKNERAFECLIYHLSYFAKIYSKENNRRSSRNFFMRQRKT